MAKYKQSYVRLPTEDQDVKVEVSISAAWKMHECLQVTSGAHPAL